MKIYNGMSIVALNIHDKKLEKHKEKLLYDIRIFEMLENKKESNEAFLVDYILLHNKINDVFEYLLTYYRYIIRINAKEYVKEAEEKVDYYYDIQDKFLELDKKYQERILTIINLENIIDKTDELVKYKNFFNNMKVKNEQILYKNLDTITRDLEKFRARDCNRAYQKEISILKVKLKESKLSYYDIMKCLKQENDEEKRKQIYQQLIDELKKGEERFTHYLSQIKQHQLYMVNCQGFDSPLTYILKEYRMNEDTLNRQMNCINKLATKFEQYNFARIKRNQKTKALNEFELYEVLGEMKKESVNIEEAKEIIENAFSYANKELSEIAEMAFKESWIDYESREGKVNGSYTNMLHISGKSIISTNFAEDLDSVCTMGHELGHAFHGYLLRDIPYANIDYPIPIAETFSLFCENIIYVYLINIESDKKRKSEMLELFLNNIMYTLLDYTVWYLFEKAVFANNGELAFEKGGYAKALVNIKEKIYGAALNKDSINEVQWMIKTQNYFVDYYYYNFPYVLGMLVSLSMIDKLKKGSLNFGEIKMFLKNSGIGTVEEIVANLGINLSDDKFWNEIEVYIEALLDSYSCIL